MIIDFFKKAVFYVALNVIFSVIVFTLILSVMYGEFPPSFHRIRNQTNFLQEVVKKGTSIGLVRDAALNHDAALRAAEGELGAAALELGAVNPSQIFREQISANERPEQGLSDQDQVRFELKQIRFRLQSLEAEQLAQLKSLNILQGQIRKIETNLTNKPPH